MASTVPLGGDKVKIDKDKHGERGNVHGRADGEVDDGEQQFGAGRRRRGNVLARRRRTVDFWFVALNDGAGKRPRGGGFDVGAAVVGEQEGVDAVLAPPRRGLVEAVSAQLGGRKLGLGVLGVFGDVTRQSAVHLR